MSVSNETLEKLFQKGRTFKKFIDKSVDDNILREVYKLSSYAPTTFGCSPMRVRFIKNEVAKKRLIDCVALENRAVCESAPVIAVIAFDSNFTDRVVQRDANLAALINAQSPEWKDEMMVRNGDMQGAYFIMAARAMDLDCCPISGFDNAAVDAMYFQSLGYESNFLVCLGYGDRTVPYNRAPRLTFDDACRVL